MAVREGEICVDMEILDEVASLFVDQFEHRFGISAARADIQLIEESADEGEDVLFKTVSSVFGDKLDDALVGAANDAMDYLRSVDEQRIVWFAEGEEKALELATSYFESLRTLFDMACKNKRSVVKQIAVILKEGEEFFQYLKETKV